MAITLTDQGDLTYASFPISKFETDEDGDLIVHGKASDGGIDSDQQIVDPAWMAKAVQEWMTTGGNVRVQHNPQRDPAGVGVKAETDASGATFVTSKVFEPTAMKLVSKGALRAYSVGIARPTIVRDAKAPGGRITGGELVEISLVDRPANKRCGIQLVKSVDGAPEYTGEVFGSDEDITKALDADLTKSDTFTVGKTYEGNPNMEFSMPDDMTFTFTPNDLAKILQNKFIEQHYDDLAKQALYDEEKDVYKRDVATSERRSLASSGHALPDGSYPIANAGDLSNAAHLAASGHGNAEAAKKLIARRAKELGVANPLSSSDSQKGESVADAATDIIEQPEAVKEADPEVTKEPETTDEPKAKKAKKPKGGKKMPPWMQDKDGDDDSKSSDDSSCKADHAHTEKCQPSGTPQSTSGAKDAQDMKEAPLPTYEHSPMPAGRNTPEHKNDEPELHTSPEMAAMLRFKTIGIDTDLGRLHDLSCPAFDPEVTAQYHPFSDFKNVVNEGLFRRKALDAAAGKSLDEAMSMQQVWQAAAWLKNADQELLNTCRDELHKAFRDANPGPTSYPTPGSMSPGKYSHGPITGGHAANSPGYGGPNTSPSVASGPVGGAGDFNRPPLSSGHQTPSPAFMKVDFEKPTDPGTPTRLNYAHMQKEQALNALSRLHTHVMSMVPNVCPMDMNSQGPVTPNPAITAVKADEPVVEKGLVEGVAKAPMEAAFSDEWIEKAFKKTRKKLGKKVLSGSMTVDEARSKLGRMGSQKDVEVELKKGMEDAAIDMVDAGTLSIDDARKALGLDNSATKADVAEVTKSVDTFTKAYSPDLIKSAVMEAVEPLQKLLTEQRESFDAKIAAQQKVIDAIADSPDPRGEPFSGMAMNINKSARPAGVPEVAETAARTQQMVLRQLEHTWRTSDNPAERESAYAAAQKIRGNL